MPVRALTGCDTVPCYFGIGKGTASWLSFCLISMLLMVIENVIAQSIEFLSACYLLLLVWHAPLGARSAKRRHQSPEWTLLSHINASSRERLLDFRSCWIVFIHVVRWCPVMIFLASVSFVVSAMWPNKERRRGWTLDNSQQAWLPSCLSQPRRSADDGTIWFLTAFANTTDRGHQSWVHLSWWLPSNQSRTGR